MSSRSSADFNKWGKKKERKKSKIITRAEQNSKPEKPDPSRPVRDLNSESQHISKAS